MEKFPENNIIDNNPEEAIRRGYNESYSEGEDKMPAGEVVEFVKQYGDRLGHKVIDIGSGAGRNLVYLAKQGYEVTGIDISDNGVRATKETLEREGLNGEVLVGDVGKLPFKDEAFDSAISRRVLDYSDTESAAQKLVGISHIIKPGGLFFLVVRSNNQPTKDNEEFIEDNEWGGKTYRVKSGGETGALQHYFTEAEIISLSKSAGFSVERIIEKKKEDKKELREKAEWLAVLKKDQKEK